MKLRSDLMASVAVEVKITGAEFQRRVDKSTPTERALPRFRFSQPAGSKSRSSLRTKRRGWRDARKPTSTGDAAQRS